MLKYVLILSNHHLQYDPGKLSRYSEKLLAG
jgi:hypothetical protein